jgi:uncharacterized repeat protein (TIGR01451 family)
MSVIKLLAGLGVGAAAMVSVGRAQSPAAPKALLVTAENLTAIETRGARDGSASVLKPGDVVRYQLIFTNTRPDSVRRVQFNDRVPRGLRFVEGSASADRSDVVVEFSIDSGRTYALRPEIDVIVNGERVRRPAPADRYTHVRWSAQGWVRPQASVTAEFRVQLPAVAGDR